MYDGRDVIIPNAELFTESVIVNTAHARRRSEYDVGISYGDDIDRAKKLILEAIQSVEGVLSEPEPEVLVIELADFTVNIRARWWTSARRAAVIKTHDKVLATVKKKLVANGVTLPLPTYKVLFHS
jgi:small-conductance mechanosensitive channel